jgi:2-desacetyl-2-hydroxyethyl bacteriochlorophyllide A dehydrogenase
MRAFVITGPGAAAVEDVPEPDAAPGDVVVDVARAGVCGTDVELFTGEMAYLHEGHTHYPVRIGHEWTGTVSRIGEGVDRSWLGRRVIGDTMIGCGVCARCRDGRQHLCEVRGELGIRDGRPGALAEKIALPARFLHALPDAVDDAMGAMVEPGGNALRAVRGADLHPGRRVLVLGAGTIGLLVALFARAEGADVHVVDRSSRSREFARGLGFDSVSTQESIPAASWDAVIDASNDPQLPALAVDLVEPGRRVVFIGLAGSPSRLDTRALVLKDVTAVGVLSASGGLQGAIAAYASGSVDPRPLIAAVVPLEGVAGVLAGRRPDGSGPGPKFHAAV